MLGLVPASHQQPVLHVFSFMFNTRQKKKKKRGGLLIAFKSEKELLETPVILSLVAKN